MTRKRFQSLRVRLLLLVLLAIIPAFGLVLLNGFRQRNEAAEAAQVEALRLAEITAKDQERIVSEAHQLLTTLAQLPFVQSGDAERCNAFFNELLSTNETFAFFGVAALNGDLYCSAPTISDPVNLIDRPYFRALLSSEHFVVGEYQIGRVTGLPVIAFAHPVFDEDGELSGAVINSISLNGFGQAAGEIDLPEGASLTLIDQNGTILARVPDGEEWVGRTVPDDPLVAAVVAAEEVGSIKSTGLDGEPRLFGISQIRFGTENPEMYLAIGVPTSVAFAEANSAISSSLIGLIAISVLVFAVTWVGSEVLILRQVRTILRAIDRLAGGDLSARTDLPREDGELSLIGQSFNRMADRLEQRELEHEHLLAEVESSRERYQTLFREIQEGFALHEIICNEHGEPHDYRFLEINPAFEAQTGLKESDVIGKTVREVLPGIEQYWIDIYGEVALTGNPAHFENYSQELGKYYEVIAFSPKENQFATLFVDVTERRKAELRFRSLFESAPGAIFVVNERGQIEIANPQTVRLFGYEEQELIGQPIENLIPERFRDDHKAQRAMYIENPRMRPMGSGLDLVGLNKNGREFPVDISLNAMKNGREKNIMAIVWDISEKVRAEGQIKRQLKQLRALRQIDLAITSSVNIELTLNVLLDQVITNLEVDAADVLLVSPHTRRLEYAVGKGFRTPALQHTDLGLGQGYAGQAVRRRQTIHIPDLQTQGTDFLRSPWFSQEGFVACLCVPLIAKGEVQGVLEVFLREQHSPDPEWLDFLEILAGQAAIAIDNTSLFQGLQRSNAELLLAYDATLEGWSRALELRDDETEGHSQRVTEMTMHLARAMNLDESELAHVRRGALLHDIGKIGIPDSILLKPGPLDDEEWAVMRQHPVYAHEMLSPITYLRPALDIPYCHHERWDASGYPRGLEGEQIPLPARIFAVVDVWDALTSDRPYRKAWPDEKVIQHLQSQAETHFDPQVVETFFQILSKENGFDH